MLIAQVGQRIWCWGSFLPQSECKEEFLEAWNLCQVAPRYCGPFELLEIIWQVAYRLAFPTSTRAHNVFHVSLLKKYVHDPNHVINWGVIQVELEGEFQTEPSCILNKKVTVLQNRSVVQVKVQWKHYSPNECTSQLEDAMRLENPFLFNFAEH